MPENDDAVHLDVFAIREDGGGDDGGGEDVGFGAGTSRKPRRARSRRPWLLGGGAAAVALAGIAAVLSTRDERPAAVVAPTTTLAVPLTTPLNAPLDSTSSVPGVSTEATTTHALTFGSSGMAVEDFPWTIYLRTPDDTRGYQLSLAPVSLVPLEPPPMGVLTIGASTVVLDDNDLGPVTTYLGPDGSVWTSWSNIYLRLSFGAGGLSGVVETLAPTDVFGVPGLAPFAGTTGDGRPVIVAPDGSMFAVQRENALSATTGSPGMENGVHAAIACTEAGTCSTNVVGAESVVAVPGLVTRIDVAPSGGRVACWTDDALFLVDLPAASAQLLDDRGALAPPGNIHGGIGWSPDSRWYVYSAVGDATRIVDTDDPSRRLEIGVDESMTVAGVG